MHVVLDFSLISVLVVDFDLYLFLGYFSIDVSDANVIRVVSNYVFRLLRPFCNSG